MKKLILILMIALLILTAGCKDKEEEREMDNQIMIEEPSQEEIGNEEGEQGKVVKLIGCNNERNEISAEISNIGDEDAVIAGKIKILVNGLLVAHPECDKLTLAPGETTYCTDISGLLAIRTGKVNTIVVNSPAGRAIEYIDCAE